jgi:hypothetical protein
MVKCTLVQALRLCTGRTAHRESRGIVLPFHDHSIRRGEGSAPRPGLSLPPGKTRYSLYRRLGGPEGRSGQVRKISPPPGFDPRTVQPVASRYTVYATQPTHIPYWHHQLGKVWPAHTMDHRGSGCISPLILNLGTRWRLVISPMTSLLYPRYALNRRLVSIRTYLDVLDRPGFQPWIVQPVHSAIPTPTGIIYIYEYCKLQRASIRGNKTTIRMHV